MKKKLIIKIIIIILIFTILIYTGISLYELKKEQDITNDIIYITNVFSPSLDENEEVDDLLINIKNNKGDYKVVEENIKSYYKDVYSSIKNLNFLLKSDYNYLSSENLNNDKTTFIKSKENIDNTKNQLTEMYNSLVVLSEDEDTIYSYLDKDLSNYYRKFYKSLITDIENDSWINDFEKEYTKKIERLDNYNNAIDFLILNYESWQIKDNLLVFDDQTLYDDYIKITEKLNN